MIVSVVKNGVTWNQELRLKLKISRRFPKEQKAKGSQRRLLCLREQTENHILDVRNERGNNEYSTEQAITATRGPSWRQNTLKERQKDENTYRMSSVGTKTLHSRLTEHFYLTFMILFCISNIIDEVVLIHLTPKSVLFPGDFRGGRVSQDP